MSYGDTCSVGVGLGVGTVYQDFGTTYQTFEPVSTIAAFEVARPGSGPHYGVGVAEEIQKEKERADRALMSRINTSYDVVPDVAVAVQAAANSDFPESIAAMRRAALVNPEALMGTDTKLSQDIAADANRAQRVRYALMVFKSPPQRVVSEADAHFMVAALSAALGDDNAARTAIENAKQTGDTSASTELLSRAIVSDQIKQSGPWIQGTPLR